jgi:sorbose reductase
MDMAIPKVQTIKELRSVYDMFSLKGKAALVTGAGGGIGRSTAAAFAEMGAKVALMDIPQKEDSLKQNVADIKERYGAEAMYVMGDVADEASVKKFVGQVVDAYGTIDIVHNNAGIGIAGDDSNIPVEQWNRIVAVNQTGILLVGRTCANIMIEHKHGGSIVNTSSMSGLIVNRLPAHSRYGVVYPATKAAVEHLTKAMAMDYCDFGIRFNSVCYGYIISGLHDVKAGFPVEAFDAMAADTPMGRTGSLEEAVGCVAYLASDLSTFATGSTVVVDGGYTVW